MNWINIFFLLPLITDHTILSPCWASVIWDYDGGGRHSSRQLLNFQSYSQESHRRQKRKSNTEHHFRIAPSLAKRLFEGFENPETSDTNSVRTVVSPFINNIPSSPVSSTSLSLLSSAPSSAQRLYRDRSERRKQKRARRRRKRLMQRRRKGNKKSLSRRRARNLDRASTAPRPPGMGYLRACPHSDRYYCLNGGSCYIIAGIGAKTCRCTKSYTGTRCGERSSGLAELMQWKIVNGRTELARIRTRNWKDKHEDNDEERNDTADDRR